nr:alpha-protein kinase 1 isoform X1 [Pogona vitticeps]
MGTNINIPKVVSGLLQECQQMLDQLSPEVEVQTEGDKMECQQYEALLPDDLRTLIEEAKEMKWPFVPERWQYKEAVHLEDKTNLQDMISAKLCDLLVYLKASIITRDYETAAAIVFLVDRFLYWVDGSTQLLQIVKKLHRLHPTVPVAPQLMIRQARVSVNSGKLLKAEYILSSLINDSGATGVWKYSKESDRILVQSVCIQIRGQILQKLGMWYEAAELIWASILGYFTLPQPDKKGIGTSLGILADIFVSMNENDYSHFKNNYQFDLHLLKEFDHRLLSAAEACKLAAAFCQFTSLFVLTAMNIRGTCLLSYSCSSACPSEKEMFYLSEAKKSFEIGLLTKNNKEPVTSKQELHSFVKAAFCLSKVHQRLYGESERLSQVNQFCQEALEKLYAYSHSSDNEQQDKGQLAKDIMSLVMSAKEQLHVQSFPNSDTMSYIPDGYKTDVNKPIVNGEMSFEKVLKMHSQHHEAVCDVFESTCRSHKVNSQEEGKRGACITTLKTETRNVDTMCMTEEKSHCGSDAAKNIVSQKLLKCYGVRKGQIQNKLSHDAAVDVSLGEETESEASERNQNRADDVLNGSQSGSEVSSSLRSWSKFSRSNLFTSWEDIDCHEDELPQDKVQNTKGRPDKEQARSAALSGDVSKNVQGSDFCCFSSKMHQVSLQETQHDCTSHLKQSFQYNVALTDRVMDLEPNVKHLEGAIDVAKRAYKENGGANSRNSHDNLNSTMSLTSEQDAFGITFSSAIDSRTKDNTENSAAISKPTQYISRNENPADPEWCKRIVEPVFKQNCTLIDQERETVDTTKDAQMMPHHPDDRATGTSIDSNMPKLEYDNYIQNWINKSVTTMAEGCSFEIPEVDPQAETAEDWEIASNIGRRSEDHRAKTCTIQDQQNHPTISPSRRDNKLYANQSIDCTTTEEEEGEKIRKVQSSSSSLKSWYNASNFSSSFSDLEVPSFLNSSGSSFVFMQRIKEQNLKARILNNDEYDRLLSGVEHDWLMQRMKNMGLFKPNLLHQAHSALLLKYSKKSGLWTAQETAVYTGDYLSVAKKGKQRNAFWIHFLHQEETLGRYVGKEYKDEKELLHHFNDVERQMTAQYYVTEFNKRLYEHKIPTQIFYIPSVILMILEGRSIQGCISVEPYILGEFVKLSNNTKVVKLEYKATEYGLAYGHFCYEFSQGTDVVVDLQGWVTGNGKGLIYLTDPQIHSVSQNKVSCLTNFGKKGIYYFFNNQHIECNEICHHLSLSRPLIEKPN